MVPAVLVGLPMGALWLTTYDYTARLSKAILWMPNAKASDAALTAALRVQFPDGTSVARLKQFSAELAGECFVGPDQFTANCGADPRSPPAQCTTTLYCKVPVSGIFCMGTWMTLRAHLQPGNTISDLSARGDSVGC